MSCSVCFQDAAEGITGKEGGLREGVASGRGWVPKGGIQVGPSRGRDEKMKRRESILV